MKNMTRKEQQLLQKTLEAKRIKNSRPHGIGKLATLSRTPSRQHSASATSFDLANGLPGGWDSNSPGGGGGSRGPYSPQMHSSRSNLSESIRNVEKYYENEMSENDMALTKELSNRGLTQEAYVRKMTNEALKRASQIDAANYNDDVDIFLPKVRKVRPDGATLSQVYESKREDIWGKILKEQIVEEDRHNMEKKVRKELADANYGRSLRQQLRDREAMDKAYVDPGEVLAKAKGSFDLFEIRNRQRIADKSKNHSAFVCNALEDMAKKRQQKNKELQRELEASAFMIRKSKQDQAVENEKIAMQRKKQAAEQNRLLLENFEILEKRRLAREKKHSDDRTYVRDLDAKFQREEDRRQAEKERKAATNSTERGAFVMASKVYAEKTKATEDFFTKNQSSTNLLNVTLQTSEQNTNARAENSKAALRQEFLIQKKLMAETRNERGEELAEQKIIITAAQKKYHADLEKERHAKVKAATTYQKLLDAQLNSMRQASLHALEETMAPKEKGMNSELLKKFGLSAKK